MAFSNRNLCNTVENFAQYKTLPCSVPRLKVTPLYARVAAEDNCPDYAWDTTHQWPCGDRKEGRCLRCGLLLKDVRVRVNPKTGEPARRSIARDIAFMHADVPEIQFVGAQV